MKYFTLVLALILIASAVSAGTIRQTPQDIVLTDPTTHQVELNTVTFYYSDTSPYAEISFNIVSNDGNVLKTHTLRLTGSDFTAFTSGYLSTIVSRVDTYTWAYIQTLYDTQE